MKRLLLLVVGALLLLVAVMLVQTMRVPQPDVSVHANVPSVTVDSALASQRLAGAVQLATVSMASGAPVDTAAFLAFHQFLATSFPNVHATLTREVIGSLSLLYKWTGTDTTKSPIVLMGHMDVVPVPEANMREWTHAPFSGAIADGYIWGRGTLDDKTTVLSSLEAIEGLINSGYQPPRTVYLMFGHDEEVGGRFGARVMVDTLVACSLPFQASHFSAGISRFIPSLMARCLPWAKVGPIMRVST